MSLQRVLVTVACLVLAAGGAGAADPKLVSIAHIKLSGDLEDAPLVHDPLFGTGGQENFKSKLDRIKKAQKDAAIQGLYLHIDGVGLGWGKLDELRQAVAEFRKAGKKAYAYLDSAESHAYLLALACDRVCLPESGTLMLTGLRAEVSFYKDLFEKLGVHADMLQMGDFKGAAEPYTRSGMSPQFRKQYESVLDDYYEDLVNAIARARPERKWTADQVKRLIDDGPYTARRALALGLIDQIGYEESFKDWIKAQNPAEIFKVVKNYAQAKADELDTNPFTLLSKLLSPPKARESGKPKLAVIYASGVINTGKSGASLFGGQTVGSTTLVEAIRQAENDKTVRAIVLRVDSPGGSALASDLIWNELVKCKKPVVASMSDVAASGGYYISMGCRKIYAEPGTLTGSIGVVGGKLALGGLYDKVGLKTEVITRGANANVLSDATPFSPSEKRAMLALMADIYDQFLDKALQGRARAGKALTRPQLEQLAAGRIWTGRQAKANGLIDELGTLEDAMAAARTLAEVPQGNELELLILPKAKTFLDTLMDARSGETRLRLPVPAELSGPLGTVEGMLRLRGEPVWVVMPHHVRVR